MHTIEDLRVFTPADFLYNPIILDRAPVDFEILYVGVRRGFFIDIHKGVFSGQVDLFIINLISTKI